MRRNAGKKEKVHNEVRRGLASDQEQAEEGNQTHRMDGWIGSRGRLKYRKKVKEKPERSDACRWRWRWRWSAIAGGDGGGDRSFHGVAGVTGFRV